MLRFVMRKFRTSDTVWERAAGGKAINRATAAHATAARLVFFIMKFLYLVGVDGAVSPGLAGSADEQTVGEMAAVDVLEMRLPIRDKRPAGNVEPHRRTL